MTNYGMLQKDIYHSRVMRHVRNEILINLWAGVLFKFQWPNNKDKHLGLGFSRIFPQRRNRLLRNN